MEPWGFECFHIVALESRSVLNERYPSLLAFLACCSLTLFVQLSVLCRTAEPRTGGRQSSASMRDSSQEILSVRIGYAGEDWKFRRWHEFSATYSWVGDADL